MMDRVIVITVCYNAVSEIENTLKSIISQNYSNIELIVIDGASSDGTVEVIRRYEKSITKWISEKDRGIYDAMNKGISLVNGDDGWIIFMNAGDSFYSKDVCSRIFSNSIENDVGLLYGDVVFPTPWGTLKKNCEPREGEPEQLCHQCVFARVDLMKRIGFDLSYKVAADGRFFKAVKDLGMKFEYRPVFVAKYDNFEGVSSQNRMRVFRDYARMQGLRPLSLRWIMKYFRYSIRAVLSKILPVRADMFLRYLSMQKSWRITIESNRRILEPSKFFSKRMRKRN